MKSNVKSLYIHIPFCNKICSYCDFCKLLYNDNFIDKYLDSLEREIKTTYKGEVIETIYIGGGTPSCLSYKQLKRLFEIISIIKKSSNLEFTIEGNFDSTTFEKLNLYKEYGVNRLSFGIETTDSNLLKFLNRELDKNEVIDIINYSNDIGLNNINVDLMYALPEEDLTILKKDLEFICSLNIKHISTYSLIIEKNTVLSINGCKNIDEDLDLKMYIFIRKFLKNKGFIQYEISNFSKEGYESKHNLVYWKNQEYYGFGIGASSYIGNKRINNTRSINKYLVGEVISSFDELTIYDTIEYEIMLGLRTSYGINKEKFRKLYGKDIEKCYNYSSLINDGFILEDLNHIWINPDNWYISNEIIIKFLEGEIDG